MFLGSYSHSPYKVDLSNVSEAYLSAEGQQYPAVALNPDPTADDANVSRAYVEYLKTAGWFATTDAPTVTMRDFMDGYGVLAFDLSRWNGNADMSTSMPRVGSLHSHIKFSSATTQATTCIYHMVCMMKYSLTDTKKSLQRFFSRSIPTFLSTRHLVCPLTIRTRYEQRAN